MQMKVRRSTEQAPSRSLSEDTVNSRDSIDVEFDSSYPSAKAGVTRRSLSRRRLSTEAGQKRTDSISVEDSARGSIVSEDAVYPKRLAYSIRPGHGSGSSESVAGINFLHDPPEGMTYGRKLALSLFDKKWYNPRAGEQKYEDLESSSILEAGMPSLKKAWTYFEHVILTRYIVEEHNTDVTNWGCFRKCSFSFKNYDEDFERAQPGENQRKTKLYDPITTPHMQV